jgi:hypothetical protein
MIYTNSFYLSHQLWIVIIIIRKATNRSFVSMMAYGVMRLLLGLGCCAAIVAAKHKRGATTDLIDSESKEEMQGERDLFGPSYYDDTLFGLNTLKIAPHLYIDGKMLLSI